MAFAPLLEQRTPGPSPLLHDPCEQGGGRELAQRLVVVGDSFFLNNRMIDSAANRDFAVLAINWLLDRTELMTGLGPRAIKEFRLNITQSHMAGLRWILLLGMPGSALLVGLAVWARRRR